MISRKNVENVDFRSETNPGNFLQNNDVDFTSFSKISIFFFLQIEEFSRNIPLAKEEAEHDSEENMEENVGIKRYDQLRENVNAVILAQQSALEILTNVCCGDDEAWEEEEASESGESDMIDESEIENGDGNNSSVVTDESKLPTVVLEALLGQDLSSKVSVV